MLGGSYLGESWLAAGATLLDIEAQEAFTTVEIVGAFATQAGSPAAGTITFTLTQPMANDGIVALPTPIVATLDATGRLVVRLYANDDAATVPTGVQYGVTEQIVGAQPRDYFILLSHSETPVDISTLMPGDTGWT